MRDTGRPCGAKLAVLSWAPCSAGTTLTLTIRLPGTERMMDPRTAERAPRGPNPGGRRAWIGFTAFAAVFGCSEPQADLPPVRVRLERVEYRSTSDLSSCLRAPREIENRIIAVENALGVRGPELITYVHVSDPAYRGPWPCPSGALGCSDADHVYSRSYVHHHEVVHAAASLLGRPNALLAEGLATAFGYDSVVVPAEPGHWQDLVALPVGQSDYGAYASGAALVAYLYRTWGGAALVEFYRSATADATRLAALFESQYGVSLDEAWVSAHQTGAPYVCTGLADIELDGREQLSAEMTCPGPSDDARHVFSVDQPTALAIDTNYYQAALHACDAGTSPALASLHGDGTGARGLYLASWAPGRYFVSRGQSAQTAAGDASFRAEARSFVGSTCADGALTPIELIKPPSYLEIVMHAGSDRHLVLESPGAEQVQYSISFSDELFADWYACRTCEAIDCLAVDRDHPLTLMSGLTWLVVALRPGRPLQDAHLVGTLAAAP
jgi:hypothetical protein